MHLPLLFLNSFSPTLLGPIGLDFGLTYLTTTVETKMDQTSNFSRSEVGVVFTWEMVNAIHQTRNGIFQRKGRLVSLLTDFGRINPCYPDEHGDDTNTIFYTGNGRRGDQKLDAPNRALLDAVNSAIAVPLFNKIAVGQWQFMGYWRVVGGVYIFDESQDRMVWKFTLQNES
jgi:hypothetical protein